MRNEGTTTAHRPRCAAAPACPARRDRGQPALVLAPGIAGSAGVGGPGPVGRMQRRSRPGLLGERQHRPAGHAGQGPQVPAPACRTSPTTCASTWSSRAGTSDNRNVRPRPPTRRCRPRSPTSHPSSASPRCCRSTPAAWASWPVTTSSRPPTSARRSSGSACSTGPATSPSRCPARAGSRSATPRWTPRACRSRRCVTPSRTWSGSPWSCRRAGSLLAQVWVASVGRVPLLLLDSDVEDNDAAARGVTDRLYGGGPEHRLLQELLLGVGGVRAVRAYCAATGHPSPRCFTPTRATPASWASSGSAS